MTFFRKAEKTEVAHHSAESARFPEQAYPDYLSGGTQLSRVGLTNRRHCGRSHPASAAALSSAGGGVVAGAAGVHAPPLVGGR